MRQLICLLAGVTVLASSVVAQQKATPHASRDAVIAFLRSEGILHGKTRVRDLTWDQNANWWFVSLQHPGGKISSWTVDADAKDYHYVCKH